MMDMPPTQTIIVTGQPLPRADADAVYGGTLLDTAALKVASGRLEDALRSVAGVQLFRRSSSRTANPTAEGVTARGLGGNAASRMMVTLDGVPQADPFFGFVNWPALSARPLGSAFVVRGGGSAAAGPGALAGTVALESGRQSEAVVRGGSRAGLDARMAASLDAGAGSLSLFAGYGRGDGHVLVSTPGLADVPARYAQWAAGGRAALPLGAGELQVNVSAFDDSRLRGVKGADIGARGGDASLRFVKRGGWEVEAVGWAQLRDLSTRTLVLNADRSVAALTLDQLQTPSTGLGARIELRAPALLRMGVDVRHVAGFTQERFRFVERVATRLREAGGSSLTTGGFAEADVAVGEELMLAAAARIDHWRLGQGRLLEIAIPEGRTTLQQPSAARSGWEPTGRMGLQWQPQPALRLRAAAYTGWRLPTLNELHRPFRVGADATAANAMLRPERLYGGDAGISWQPLDGASIGITGFLNRLENPVANVTLASGPGVFPGVGFVPANGFYRQRQNLAAIDSHGLEADARLQLRRVQFHASLAWLRATVRGSTLDGLDPAQTPQFALTAGADWVGEEFGGRMLLRHAGAQWEDDRNTRRLAAATTIDIGLSARLSAQWRLTVDAENLLDTPVATGFSGAQPERGQPQTIWLGLRWGP